MKPSEERYQESFVVNDRADWMLIKDRAPGKVILVNADDPRRLPARTESVERL